MKLREGSDIRAVPSSAGRPGAVKLDQHRETVRSFQGCGAANSVLLLARGRPKPPVCPDIFQDLAGGAWTPQPGPRRTSRRGYGVCGRAVQRSR